MIESPWPYWSKPTVILPLEGAITHKIPCIFGGSPILAQWPPMHTMFINASCNLKITQSKSLQIKSLQSTNSLGKSRPFLSPLTRHCSPAAKGGSPNSRAPSRQNTFKQDSNADAQIWTVSSLPNRRHLQKVLRRLSVSQCKLATPSSGYCPGEICLEKKKGDGGLLLSYHTLHAWLQELLPMFDTSRTWHEPIH